VVRAAKVAPLLRWAGYSIVRDGCRFSCMSEPKNVRNAKRALPEVAC
jgi:hypothetical protein